MQVRSLGYEDPLEEGMATHSSILAWGIPWTEEPVGLKSQKVGHNCSDSTSAWIFLVTVTGPRSGVRFTNIY